MITAYVCTPNHYLYIGCKHILSQKGANVVYLKKYTDIIVDSLDKNDLLILHFDKTSLISIPFIREICRYVKVILLAPNASLRFDLILSINNIIGVNCQLIDISNAIDNLLFFNTRKKYDSIMLKRKELRILFLTSQGKSVYDISKKLNINIKTVYFIKRKTLMKLGARNISEFHLFIIMMATFRKKMKLS